MLMAESYCVYICTNISVYSLLHIIKVMFIGLPFDFLT